MPKKNKTQEPTTTTTLTLQDAIDYIYNLPNADGTKKIWSNAITNITAFETPNYELMSMTNEELAEKFNNTNIAPILQNYDKTVAIIEKNIKNKHNGLDISPETIKQYYLAIFRLSQKDGAIKMEKELREKYSKKYKEFDAIGNKLRDQNIPKRAFTEHPDLTWDKINELYEEYISTHAFTKTEKGRRELRYALLAGLYILRPPRRVEDFELLQYYSKTPTEAELKDRNVVVFHGNTAKLYIDDFKTRYRVRGQAKEKSVLMERYEKELPARLTSLLKDYIKNWDIPDNSKLKATDKVQLKNKDKERRDKMIADKLKTLPKKTPVGYFVFFKETGEKDEIGAEGGFSKVVATALQKVLGRSKVTVNTIRHAWNTWLVEHLQEFTDEQIKQFAIDVGDTPRNMPTHLRYRHANQQNAGMEKSDIYEGVRGDEYVKKMMDQQHEEEASVGDVDEINSPADKIVETHVDKDELYKRLGKALMEVEMLKAQILKHTV